MKILLNKKEKELLNKLDCNVEFLITKTDSRGILKKITGKNLGKKSGFTDMKIRLCGAYKEDVIPEKHIFFSSKNIQKALKELLLIYRIK